jgi:hypothetical protein
VCDLRVWLSKTVQQLSVPAPGMLRLFRDKRRIVVDFEGMVHQSQLLLCVYMFLWCSGCQCYYQVLLSSRKNIKEVLKVCLMKGELVRLERNVDSFLNGNEVKFKIVRPQHPNKLNMMTEGVEFFINLSAPDGVQIFPMLGD